MRCNYFIGHDNTLGTKIICGKKCTHLIVTADLDLLGTFCQDHANERFETERRQIKQKIAELLEMRDGIKVVKV